MKKTTSFVLGVMCLALQSVVIAQDPGFREAEPRRQPNTNRESQETQKSVADDTAGSVANITSMASLDDTRPLRIGDRVIVRIVENRDEPRSLIVQDSGDINAPFLNLVKAAGKTCKEVAYYMKKELEKQYFQTATVIVALERGRKERERFFDMDYITIYGQVMRQGRYELSPEEELTISQAVLRAGGLAQFAKKERVKLIRTYPNGQRKNFIVNLDDIMRKGKLQYDIPIRSNDVIIVEEKLVNF